MKAYRLLKDGQLVHVFRSTVTTLDGRDEHLTRGEVGHAGQVFIDLPEHVTDPIDAGKMEGTWEVIELPDPEVEEADEDDSTDVEVSPTAEPVAELPVATSRRRTARPREER